MENEKKQAGLKAIEWIKEGMIVGLGTGSTAYWAILALSEKVKAGLKIGAVSTSLATEQLAKAQGIEILPFNQIQKIDVSIDGADEVDPAGNLIKGGGGALLREKIIAYNSTTYLTIVDELKQVTQLGKFPLPVEILPFASELTVRRLGELGSPVALRQKDGKTFVTDNGNFIADIQFGSITEPDKLNTILHAIPGVLETGLFSGSLVSTLIIGTKGGEVMVKPIQHYKS